jgi:hypothetical protein
MIIPVRQAAGPRGVSMQQTGIEMPLLGEICRMLPAMLPRTEIPMLISAKYQCRLRDYSKCFFLLETTCH